MFKVTICSHTIVKNGMPFIKPVLQAAEPFVDRMIITVSVNSNDDTWREVKTLEAVNPKVIILYENVENPGQLTQERQRQVDMTKEDWIWFLDDDDYWEPEETKKVLAEIEVAGDNVDAFSINPRQLLSATTQDANWINKKFFTKFFRNKEINYRHPWPRDLIYKGNTLLYWKTNPRVKNLPYRFWHLSAVKKYSFRKFDLQNFDDLVGRPIPLDRPIPSELSTLVV